MTHASLHCYGPQLLGVMSIARSTEVNVISSSTTTRRAPDSPSILSSRGGRCRTTPVSIWTCSLRAQADEVAEYLGVRDADVHVRTGVRIPADSIAGQTRPAAEGFCTLGCSTASDIVVNLFPHNYGRRYHLMRAPSLAILVWDLYYVTYVEVVVALAAEPVRSARRTRSRGGVQKRYSDSSKMNVQPDQRPSPPPLTASTST